MSMTLEGLREVYAGLAMNGMLSASSPHADEIVHPPDRKALSYADDIARDAVLFADALIRALGHNDG
jgi:hypothetical protein